MKQKLLGLTTLPPPDGRPRKANQAKSEGRQKGAQTKPFRNIHQVKTGDIPEGFDRIQVWFMVLSLADSLISDKAGPLSSYPHSLVPP
jgi:hypothetical protein